MTRLTPSASSLVVPRPQSFDPDAADLGLEPWERDLLSAYVERASDSVEALVEQGVLTIAFPKWVPDYQTAVAENRVRFGRVGTPLSADGRSAITGAGQAVRFEEALVERGADIRLGHGVDAVIVDGEEVVGVRATGPSGPLSIRATGGVVFASGGFTHDRGLRRAHLPPAVLGGGAVHTNTGDFVRIATELGAPLHSMHQPWLAPFPLELADDPDMCPVFVSPGDSVIYLNRLGDRVVNEKSPYNEVARVFDRWDPAHLQYTNLLLFMVFDERVRELWAPPAGSSPEYVRRQWPLETLGNYANTDDVLVRGRDLDDLATRLGDRLQLLAATTGGFTLAPDFAAGARRSISRFEELARKGVDEDFHRGEAPIETAFFGERRPGNECPNPLMQPLGDGPLYAVILAAGTLDTKGGPRIDADGRVLDGADQAIPGLYGAGNCVASPFGQGYPAGGTPNGFALTFGYQAGVHAARRGG